MKKLLRNLLILIIVFILLTYSSSVSFANKVTELQNEQNEVKDQIESAEDELEKITEVKTESLKEIEELITKISSYQKEVDELNDKIDELETKISDAEEQIEQDEKDYEKQQDALDARLVTMYKTGETSYLDFLLSSSSLMDFISSYYLISQVAEYDTKMLEQLEEHKKKIENEKTELENDKTELDTAKKTAESKKEALQTAKKEKEKKVATLSAEEKETEEELEKLQKANEEIEKKIKEAKAAIEAAKKAAQNSGSSSASTSASSAGFIWPTYTKYKITSGWYYNSGALHRAVDISGSGISGTPAYAVADGYVVISTYGTGNSWSYGNYVLIAHYNGLYTLYAHMSSRSVQAGQTVTQGQEVGKIGSTGNSTGPHLHFEVRTGSGSRSESVNPVNYLPSN